MVARCLALVLLLAVAHAATNSGDLAALQSLKKCVQANSKGKGYLNGWGATNTGPAGNAAVSKAIQQTNDALAAAGVPGVTTNTALGSTNGGANNDDPCGNPVPWTGIQCSGDRVTQVLVSQLGPNSLPCDVGSLGSLSDLGRVQNVDFTAVGLTGSLPDAWKSGFDSLEKLVLSQNKIGGGLNGNYSQGFKKLNTLDLNQNNIGGGLPGSWSDGFPALINLVLGNNKLSGDLPTWEGGFKNAQLFGLSSNDFSGPLPSAWSFPKLRTLELYSNGFTGCLPSTWPANLPDLESLTVQDNDLSGNIPSDYENWDSLDTLQITPGNSFSGSISPKLAKTPDGKGQRFKVAPASRNSDGGYDLGGDSSSDCSTTVAEGAAALRFAQFDFSSGSSVPAPAPGPYAEAPDTADAAQASPSRHH